MYSITVNINGKPHAKDIPQSWNDLQWIDYIQALTAEKRNESDVDAVLEALTGIPRHVLAGMQPYDYRFILTQCAFYWNEQPTKESLPHDFVKVQIENDTWQKLIDAETEFKRVTQEDLPQIAAAQTIIQTYTGIDIKSMKVPEAYAYWDFFFSNSLIGQNDGKTSMIHRPMRMRSQQGLRNYNRLSGLLPVMRLRREMSPSMMRFLKPRQMSSIQRSYLRKLNRSTLNGKENMTSSSINVKRVNNE